MPTCKVTFLPMGTEVEFDPDNPPASGEGVDGGLLDIAVSNGVEIDRACGGEGVCGSCHVVIEAGAENLSPPSDDETSTLDSMVEDRQPDSRLACQSLVRGDVTARIPD